VVIPDRAAAAISGFPRFVTYGLVFGKVVPAKGDGLVRAGIRAPGAVKSTAFFRCADIVLLVAAFVFVVPKTQHAAFWLAGAMVIGILFRAALLMLRNRHRMDLMTALPDTRISSVSSSGRTFAR